MTTQAPDLHLHALEVANFMRVEALTIQPDGKHVVISGANNAGKTTTVNAIWTCLAGYSAKDMPEPVRHGEDEASITVDLGEFVITRKFTAKGSTLTVKGRDGAKIAQPQALLNSFLSAYSLDPGAFLQKREADQIDDILAVCGVLPPVEDVARITGERHQPQPGESADRYMARLSADETGIYYHRRREQGRVVESKKKAQDEAVADLEKLGGRPTQGETAASTEGLADELAVQQNMAAAYRDMVSRRDAKLRESKSHRQQANDQAMAQIRANAEAARLRDEIARLQEKLASTQADAKLAGENAHYAHGMADAAQAEADAMTADIAREADPSIRLNEIQSQIAEAGRKTRELGQRQQAARFVDQMSDEHAKAVEEHERLDKVLSNLRSLRRHLLDGVDLGIPGLSIQDGRLLLGGVTLRQCGNAWRMRLACAVATKQNPRLKLLRIDDGERFDDESLSMLLQMADEKGWQVVMTRVARSGGLTVEIVDTPAA